MVRAVNLILAFLFAVILTAGCLCYLRSIDESTSNQRARAFYYRQSPFNTRFLQKKYSGNQTESTTNKPFDAGFIPMILFSGTFVALFICIGVSTICYHLKNPRFQWIRFDNNTLNSIPSSILDTESNPSADYNEVISLSDYEEGGIEMIRLNSPN